jgi:hypothetical protein
MLRVRLIMLSHYAEYRVLFLIMLNVVTLSHIGLTVILLTVVMLSVVAEHVSLGHAVKYKCKYLHRNGTK